MNDILIDVDGIFGIFLGFWFIFGRIVFSTIRYLPTGNFFLMGNQRGYRVTETRGGSLKTQKHTIMEHSKKNPQIYSIFI
jgi:hypothetical protein